MNQRARDGQAAQAGLLVLGSALANVSTILVSLLVVRLLGKAEVGTLMGLILVYNTVALVLTGGFPQTLMYFVASHRGAERRAVARRIALTLFVLGAAAGLCLLVVGLVGDRVLLAFGRSDGVSLAPLVLFAPLPLADLPARLLPNLLVAEQRARTVSILSIVRAALSSAAVLVPVALGHGVWAVAGCYVAVGMVYGALVPYFLHQLYADLPKLPSPVKTRELFRFALPLGGTDIVSLLNQQLDRYLIMLSFPAAGFATYQAGSWQVPVVTDVPYAVGTAYAPRFVELIRAGRSREALALWQQSAEKVALIVVPVTCAFMVAADDVVRVLFTDAYAAAAPIFACYASLGLLRIAAYGTLIVSAGAPRFVLHAALLSLVSNLTLSVLFLETLGFIGPALGAAVAFLLTIVFYCWCIGRALGVSGLRVFPYRGYLRVFGVAVLSALVAVPIKLWFDGPIGLRLTLELVAVLGMYALLGTLLRVIQSADWRFAADWLRLRVARR